MNTDPLFSRVGRDTAPIFPATDAQYTTPDMPVVTPPPPPSAPRQPAPKARMALIAGGIIIALALLIAGAAYALPHGALRFGASATAPDPASVATSYCAKLTAQDYAGAYALFDANTQGLLGDAATYATVAELLDTQQGKATACQPAPATVSKDGKTADVPLAVTRAQAGEGQIDLHLALQGNSWRITQAPDAALLPYVTATQLCQDLTASPADSTAAFQLFSAKLQQAAGSPKDLQDRLNQLEFITGSIKSCAIQSFTLSADGQTGQLAAGTSFERFANVPTKLNMSVDATGTWKIDSFIIQTPIYPLQLPS